MKLYTSRRKTILKSISTALWLVFTAWMAYAALTNGVFSALLASWFCVGVFFLIWSVLGLVGITQPLIIIEPLGFRVRGLLHYPPTIHYEHIVSLYFSRSRHPWTLFIKYKLPEANDEETKVQPVFVNDLAEPREFFDAIIQNVDHALLPSELQNSTWDHV